MYTRRTYKIFSTTEPLNTVQWYTEFLLSSYGKYDIVLLPRTKKKIWVRHIKSLYSIPNVSVVEIQNIFFHGAIENGSMVY